MPEWTRYNFSNLAIEAIYELTRQQAIQNKHILTRAEFWSTPGQLYVGPNGLEQLFRAGVNDVLFIQAFGARPMMPRIAPNGQN